MTRPKNRTSQQSRERILGTATELFSERGFSAAGVDELATRSGIAKTAIYYHFGSKEGLLAAVLERAATAWIEGIRATALQADTPLERLDRSLVGMRTMLEERPWILKLIQLLALEVGDHKPEVRGVIESIIVKARDAIVEGLHEAIGLARPDAEIVAGTLLALYNGIAFGRLVAPDLVPLEQAFATLRQVVMFLVAARVQPDLIRGIEIATQGGHA